jgi:hypothetical protein
MPLKPNSAKLNATSVDILNAIRNNASANYRDYVPVADASQESIREIGAIIMNYEALQNEFLTALINRIGMVLITSKMYTNPLAMFKKGTLEFGETVEEIFVELAKGFEYDPETAETEVFKRVIPDVRAAFHIMNYQKFYKTTIQQESLRQAFLSWTGITDLIAKIVDSMYSGAAYDEYCVMLYMLAINILRGRLHPVTVPAATSANAKTIVSAIKQTSNMFEFMSPTYTTAGVHNFSVKNDQFLLVNADFDAIMDVEVLASAFNMDKAEFSGHRVLVSSFGNIDRARLDKIFANDPNYNQITDAEAAALAAIPAVLVDREFFMIFDNLYKFTENYNGQGMYWNYFYHVWKTFSVSPFANAAVFVPGTPAITSVTVTPATATVAAGQSVNLTCVVATTNFAPQTVTWTTSDEDTATVDIYGKVTVNPAATSADTVTITATSTEDSTKTDTCVITVA